MQLRRGPRPRRAPRGQPGGLPRGGRGRRAGQGRGPAGAWRPAPPEALPPRRGAPRGPGRVAAAGEPDPWRDPRGGGGAAPAERGVRGWRGALKIGGGLRLVVRAPLVDRGYAPAGP